MPGNKFSFGSASRMKEVPVGEHAELKFSGKMEMVETDCGEKYSFKINLFYHPSYESIPKPAIIPALNVPASASSIGSPFALCAVSQCTL